MSRRRSPKCHSNLASADLMRVFKVDPELASLDRIYLAMGFMRWRVHAARIKPHALTTVRVVWRHRRAARSAVLETTTTVPLRHLMSDD